MNLNNKVMYECGCFASGDNIAAHCPVHGYTILQLCEHVDSCGMSDSLGGFPECYNPFRSMTHVCKEYGCL